MPEIRRLARSCALAIAALGVTATTVAVAPAHAADPAGADRETRLRSGAVALTEKQVDKYDNSAAARRARAAAQLESRIQTAKQTALNQRGDAYSYGSVGPHAFDCSGLILYSYRSAGFDLPRTSGAQAAHTRRIAKQDMRPGDLMFFHSGGSVYHVGMFIGSENGHPLMVHSPGSGRQVTVASPWTSSWFAGTMR